MQGGSVMSLTIRPRTMDYYRFKNSDDQEAIQARQKFGKDGYDAYVSDVNDKFELDHPESKVTGLVGSDASNRQMNMGIQSVNFNKREQNLQKNLIAPSLFNHPTKKNNNPQRINGLNKMNSQSAFTSSYNNVINNLSYFGFNNATTVSGIDYYA